MRTLQRVGAGLLALTLATGVAACGDDDDAKTDTTEAGGGDGEASGDNAAFCDGVVEFNSAVSEVELDADTPEADVIAAGETLAPLFDTVAENAPDDLADTVNEFNDSVQPLTEGDAEAFSQDSTFETYTELLGGAIKACEFETVDVTGVDFAFEGVPETIEAGTVAFKFTNATEADEEHEMIVFRRADGVTLGFEELLELSEEESVDKIEFKTAAFAPPGGKGATLAELDPGAYAMVCFIPVGGGEDGPPHFIEGMIQEFSVE